MQKKNTSKKLEEPLDADSNDVLDLLDSDSGSGQEDEEDDVDADSIFLRMGEENADDSDAEEEKTLKDKLEDATTTPSPSGKQSHESAKDLPELPPRAVDESPGSYQDKLLRHEQVGAINAQQLSRARSTTTQYDPQQQLAIEFIREGNKPVLGSKVLWTNALPAGAKRKHCQHKKRLLRR